MGMKMGMIVGLEKTKRGVGSCVRSRKRGESGRIDYLIVVSEGRRGMGVVLEEGEELGGQLGGLYRL
jgi:hypothetical protein